LISVIIPTFERRRHLLLAIESVRSQLGFDELVGEILVVDDGSSDPITLADDPKLRLIRHAENRGPAAARNTGIRAARCEYLAFLDSDDVWLPDKLEAQMREARGFTSWADLRPTAFVSSYVYKRRGSAGLEVRTPVAASSTAEFLRGCWYCSGSTLMVHRSVYQTVGFLDENLHRLEDFDWFIRFGHARGRLHVCSTIGSLIKPSYSQDLDAVRGSAQILIDRYLRQGSTYRLPTWERRLLMAYLSLEISVANLIEGRQLAAATHLFRSMLCTPRLSIQLGPLWHTQLPVPEEAERLFARMQSNKERREPL